MKNLLIYVHPIKCFDYEHETLVKIQIDNSLDLGWDKSDILLATNFDYEYNGVRSVVVSDANICRFKPTVAKINVITDLFERGLIEKDLYWFHDFDAYQQEVITEAEIGIAEMALTDYGRLGRWSTGSLFFRDSTADIFKQILTVCYQYRANEERALWAMTGHDTRREAGVEEWIKGDTYTGIASRIKKLNISYNFPADAIRKCYQMAMKPIKVTHFHLARNRIDAFINGKNEIDRGGRVLVPDRLIKIFNHHGIS